MHPLDRMLVLAARLDDRQSNDRLVSRRLPIPNVTAWLILSYSLRRTYWHTGPWLRREVPVISYRSAEAPTLGSETK